MSTNGNGWKPNVPEKWTGPSGQEVLLRHPGPEFTLRLGRTQRVFSGSESVPERKEGQTDKEYAQEVLEHISDEELVGMARELIVAMVDSPKLVLNPNAENGEIGPDDTGMDFWPLYNYGMAKYFSRTGPIKVGEGESEVEVSDLETFPEETSVSGDSVDGVHVPVTESERAIRDQGLVDSAGA